jgi:hypothetical protein
MSMRSVECLHILLSGAAAALGMMKMRAIARAIKNANSSLSPALVYVMDARE